MAPPARGVQTAYHPPETNPNATSVSDPDSPDYDPNHPDYDSTLDSSSDNYFERAGTTDTGEEVRDNAEQRVDREEQTDDGWLQDFLERFMHGDRVRDQTNNELGQQANQLADGVQTRDAPPIEPANYLSYDHGQLESMVTQNANPGEVGSTGDSWIGTGNAMIQFQDEIASAINNSQADWQGQAANQARSFMADVGSWVGNAGQGAALAGTQMNIQSEALSNASNSMPVEVPWNPAEWMQRIQSSSDPWGVYSDALEQYAAHQDAHERAAQVVATYDNGLAGASTMPAFTAPPTMSGGDTGGEIGGEEGGVGRIDGSIEGPTGTGGDGGTTGSGGGGGGGTGGAPLPGGGGGGGGTGGGGSGGGSGGGGSGVPTIPGPGGGTDPGGAGPGGPGGGPGGLPGGPGGSGSGPGGGGGTGGLPPGGIPVGGGGLPGGGDTLRPGRGTSGGSGFGPGGRGFGPGGSGFGSPGAGFGGSDPDGSRSGNPFGRGGPGTGAVGPEGGARAGALAAEHAAGGGRGGALGGGAGGRGAVGGMPMGMGGARGQGDEDGEHQRPAYLVEADPDSLFGTDEMTAPPVIGE